jgi:two-component system CheB/CheR fusion protein
LAGDGWTAPAHGAGQDLREAVFDIGGPAQVVFDVNGTLIMANDAARRMFGLGVNDFGRPIQDLELSYRPLELRSHIDSLAQERRPVDVMMVHWQLGDHERIFDIRITPLLVDGAMMGTSVSYADVTESHRLREQVAGSKRELEHAYEELQTTVEELETTNEELQSTNEELETTNEEVQSTNEELETMNEELQSSNEELETMNEELRHRSDELNDVNAFLETILTTLGLAVAVLDRDQNVQIWNGKARELWGLTPDEAEDQHLGALEIGLPVDDLKPRLRATITGDSQREELVLDAVDRRGRAFECRVTLLPLHADGDRVSGTIMMMEPVRR